MSRFWEVREDPEYYDEDADWEDFLEEIPVELDRALAEPYSPFITSNS